jgi:hypothetical protein
MIATASIATSPSEDGTQWRTLTKNVGGAKRYYMEVEGANLNYFAFYMVKNNKY